MKRKIQELRELEEKTCIKIDTIVPASLLSQLNDTETARRQCYLNGWALQGIADLQKIAVANKK